ncbi:MAG: hypothetical protein ACRCU1_02800 [Alsobacter sp.]
MGEPKVQRIDISPYIEGGITIGIAVACNLVGKKRVDVLRRFDTDHAFADRVAKMISIHMAREISETRDRAGSDAAFLGLVDQIIAEAGRLVIHA